MAHLPFLKPKAVFFTPLLLALLFAIACGAAATATPAPAATKALAPAVAPAAPVAAPTPIPTVAAVPKAAPTPAPRPTPGPIVHPGKITLMVAAWGNERFDPAFGLGANIPYGRILHGYLIASNERAELSPGIATRWSVSKDGLTWTVQVRKGAKFHDGTEITAQDVLWTWQHIFGPEAKNYAPGSGSQTYSRLMDKIELAGLDEVSRTTKTPLTEVRVLISEASTSWYGILPKRDILHDEKIEAAYEKNPIAAGPMKLVRRVTAELMAFERFDDYYYQPESGFPEDRRVKFTSLDLRLIPEEATRAAAIRAGDADIAPVSLGVRKQVEAGGGRLVFGPEGVYIWAVLPGCYKPDFPCRDERVRQALDYAIDKNLIRDKLYGGPEVFQVKGWTAITPSTIGYSSNLDPRPFDPQKARQLLADAGYSGGKGFGKLIINTNVSTIAPLLTESAQLGADFWRRELGLDVEVRVGESGSLIKAWRAGDLNGQVIWRDNEARVDATGIIRSWYGDPANERRFHEDKELFNRVQSAFAVSDPERVPRVLNDLYLRLREESYELSLGYVNIPWAVGTRIVKWTPFPVAFYPSALHTITLK